MIRSLPLLIALLAGCVTTGGLPEGQRDKGFSTSRSTKEALDSAFAPRKVAVVVGIDAYADSAFPALKWASKDAGAVGETLVDPAYGAFDRVVSLTTAAQTTRDRILAEMVSLRNDLRRQDTLIVYISSHGTMALDAAGEPHLYLVAQDTRPKDLRGTAIELDELQRFFSDIRAERKALILDACYNGEAKSTLQPTVAQRIERLDEAPTLSRKVRLGEAEAHLFASTFGRPAREDDELEHGVYTYHLLDAMTWSQAAADSNTDGLVTIYEAHDLARAKTVAWTAGAQVPEAYFRMVGRNDLVLVGSREAEAASEMSQLFWYGAEGAEYDGATLIVDGREKGVLPGSVPLSPGRHRVKLIGRDGVVLQERSILVAAAEPIPLELVRQRPAYYDGFLSVGPKVRIAATDALLPLVGRAQVGVELEGGYRFVGPVRGLTLGGGLGYAPHQAKFVDAGAVEFKPRHVVWGEVGVGYRAALAAGTLGGGYRLRVTGLTALEGPGCAGTAACQSWVYLSHGLQLVQTVTLRGRWALRFAEDLGVTGIDVGGGVSAGVDVGVSVGVEVGL